LVTKFPSLATSGRHNSATITDRRNPELYGQTDHPFLNLESIQSLSPKLYASHQKGPHPQFFATSVSYCIVTVRYVSHVR